MAKATAAPDVFSSTSWQPDNPGAEDANHDNPLEGKIVSVDVRTGGEWGDYPIITVEKEDGSQVAIHAFRVVLLNEFVAKAPKIGETIRVHYGGTKQPKGNGKPYHVYKVVVVGREGGEFAWGRFGDVTEFLPEPAPEPAPPAAAPTGPTDDSIPF